MFILREINPNGQEWNTVLGKDCSVVLSSISPDVFRHGIEGNSNYLNDFEYYNNTSFGWVSDGKNITILSNDSEYYVMTSDGGTFKKIHNPHLGTRGED